MLLDNVQIVEIDYTNHRGERSKRKILPRGDMVFAANEWHTAEQWLLPAIDIEKDEERLFAVSDIHSWKRAA